MARRRLLPALVALVAMLLAPAADAQRVALWPGVTFERGVQFTPNGPVAISILRGPRPGGATTLAPISSSNTLSGRETVTAMERGISGSATVAGVNGDFSAFSDGRPSGILMRGSQLESPPYGSRSSLGILTDGTLEVRRVAFFGTWRGTAGRRVLDDLNQEPKANQISLFTSAWGAATPAIPGSTAAILFPFPWAVPGTELAAPVVELRASASVPIPAGGAVLVARGAAASALRAEATIGADVVVQLLLRPRWTGVVDAIGGGPHVVRGGVPVFRANEAFTASQLQPRAPRTAVGQLADGRVVLVAVDGRQPGYSVGLTNFELAQTLVRLGAVTAMALDGGGSTTMAFDGQLLNRPSEGRERRISNALAFLYTGVFAPPPPARVSPNGDGVDESPSLTYRVVRPSVVTVKLTAPDGSTALEVTTEQQPGRYPVQFPPPRATPAEATPTPTTLPLGTWRLVLQATDDVGQTSGMERSFVLDDTVGFLRVRKTLGVPREGGALPITWRLAREAAVTVAVLDARGNVVRSLLQRRLGAGEHSTVWNGLDRNGGRVVPERYTIRVTAVGPVGRSDLLKEIRLRHL